MTVIQSELGNPLILLEAVDFVTFFSLCIGMQLSLVQVIFFGCYTLLVNGEVTVYYQPGPYSPAPSYGGGVYAGVQAFNPAVVEAPPVPSPAPNTSFSIRLDNTTGLSIPHSGAFFGFSIEFATAWQSRTSRK